MRREAPAFRQLCAREECQLLQEYPRLLPRLLGWGLPPEDAVAVAFNATLLYRVAQVAPPFSRPGEVLERYSLDEIATLCDTYRQVAAGELEYGKAEDG